MTGGELINSSYEARRRRLVLGALLGVTCFLGLRGITNESSVMMGGDMARYVMNGVFIRDLIADGGVSSYQALTAYAERYYAKYPALSVGHHPPIPYLSVVPFYWVFGVSLTAARLAALSWFIAATWGLYAVGTRMFSWQLAAWAALLFVTNVPVLRAGQYLLSEMPMTAMLVWSVHAALRFCETRRLRHLAIFVALAALSLYAKQLAVLMFPVYAVILISGFGWRTFMTRRALIGVGIVLLLIVPIAAMTIGLAPANFNLAIANMVRLFTGARDAGQIKTVVRQILSQHLSIPTMVATVAGVVLLCFRRRQQVMVCLLWILCFIGGSVVLADMLEPGRYAFGALPAYCLLIAGLATEAHSRKAKAVAAALLAATLWWQVWTVRNLIPSGAGGYEEAAEYTLSHAKEPVVLYDSVVDTGYFVFFMRKHDPAGVHVIARADKLIRGHPRDVYLGTIDLQTELKRLGVRWIVVEDRQTGPVVLRGFHDELRRNPVFVERLRIPVVSTAAPGLSLHIYEYLEATPADLDATLNINLPLGQRRYSLTLRDLISGGR